MCNAKVAGACQCCVDDPGNWIKDVTEETTPDGTTLLHIDFTSREAGRKFRKMVREKMGVKRCTEAAMREFLLKGLEDMVEQLKADGAKKRARRVRLALLLTLLGASLLLLVVGI